MAKTIDELVIKTTVEGNESLDKVNAQLGNIDKSAQSTANTLRSFNTRTLSANIQDVAVQAELGVNWMRILGQQGSEVLAAFGPAGAAAGAALAVGIAIARPALELMGVDMRNLKEMISDLTKSTDAMQAAQRANLPTLAGLGNQYGALTAEAKRFFEVQEKLTTLKQDREAADAVKQLTKDYGYLADSKLKVFTVPFTDISVFKKVDGAVYELFAKMDGLTVKQAREIGNMMEQFDSKNPEKTVSAINDILEYLLKAGPEADNFRKQFEKTVDPLIKVNEQLIMQKNNITEAARQASEFNILLLNIQGNYKPDINAARRNFDQITAIRKEGELKVAEFIAQADEKTSKDSLDRAREKQAFAKRTQQDVKDQEADFAKTQSEAYKAAVLTNDAKRRQLGLESDIMAAQGMMRQSAEYDVKYTEDTLRLSKEYQDTLANIGEQRRKNLITSEAANKLEADALALRNQGQGNAELARAKAIADIQDEARKKNISSEGIVTKDQLDRAIKLRDQLRTIGDQKLSIGFETAAVGVGGLTKQFGKIEYEAGVAAANARRAFSDMFGSGELSPEKSKEKADGLKLITQGFQEIADAQKANVEASREWSAGWTTAMDDYVSSATNASEQASTLFNDATKGMEDAIVKFAMTGKLSFSDMANSIIADIVRIMVRKAIASAMTGGLFGFASGGTVGENQPILVGENGPEAFIPASNGTIIPNNKLGGGSSAPTQVTYNINAVDASSFRSMVARDPQFIYNITEVGRRSTPSRRLA